MFEKVQKLPNGDILVGREPASAKEVGICLVFAAAAVALYHVLVSRYDGHWLIKTLSEAPSLPYLFAALAVVMWCNRRTAVIRRASNRIEVTRSVHVVFSRKTFPFDHFDTISLHSHSDEDGPRIVIALAGKDTVTLCYVRRRDHAIRLSRALQDLLGFSVINYAFRESEPFSGLRP